ncbi:MAG: Gldg family protein [Candidatus Binatus sp.]|uniref:GldG family protein n=1 Tax=Candidatus Binatus sp. TaxID=2811406 RepID=UPI0027211075|nr:Gldg family protein [Candidatus Binatus sp.]MDO8433327.1 Gldg family protein [Candidatus Binatus sp.]
MRRSSALYGILGLVLLAFGLVDYFIASGFRVFVFINLIGGVFAIILWLTSSRPALASIAGRRSTRYGANAVVYSIAFIGLLVAINYISTLHHTRLDLTEAKVFSLSSQSINVVKQLKKPLKFYGFFQGGDNGTARSLYETFAYYSPKVTFEMVDPDRHPELAERFKVTTMGTTRVQYGGENGDGTNVAELNEEALTNAIIRATKETKKVVDFLDGHGEADPDDAEGQTGFGSIKTALEGEGYTVNKIVLATMPKVPDEVNLIVAAGPTKPLGQHELDALSEYLKHGGRMIAMFRPQRADSSIDESGLVKLVGDWGVKVGNDIVVDQVVRLFAGPALGLNPLVQTYAEHPITKGFKQRTVFPMARSLTADTNLKPGLTVTPISKTSDTSWAEVSLDVLFKQQKAQLDEKDTRGPIAVVETVDANLETLGFGKGTARMVIFGSTDFGDNQYVGNFFNRDFFVNSVDWLTGEENSISIRPRSIRASRFRLTTDQFAIVFALAVLLLPEMLLIAGIVVWWERRN